MNDRELLELAAKAAGHEYECTSHTGYPENDQHQVRDSFGTLVNWNPLTDDGDAFRLAVKLQQLVSIDAKYTRVTDGRGKFAREDHPASNACAATRRAIVRAAAEIGKSI